MNPTLQGSRERIFSWLTEQRINRHSPVCVCGGGEYVQSEEMPGHSEFQAQFEKKQKAKKSWGPDTLLRLPAWILCPSEIQIQCLTQVASP